MFHLRLAVTFFPYARAAQLDMCVSVFFFLSFIICVCIRIIAYIHIILIHSITATLSTWLCYSLALSQSMCAALFSYLSFHLIIVFEWVCRFVLFLFLLFFFVSTRIQEVKEKPTQSSENQKYESNAYSEKRVINIA